MALNEFVASAESFWLYCSKYLALLLSTSLILHRIKRVTEWLMKQLIK